MNCINSKNWRMSINQNKNLIEDQQKTPLISSCMHEKNQYSWEENLWAWRETANPNCQSSSVNHHVESMIDSHSSQAQYSCCPYLVINEMVEPENKGDDKRSSFFPGWRKKLELMKMSCNKTSIKFTWSVNLKSENGKQCRI